MARGTVPDDHPLCLGYADPALNTAVHTVFSGFGYDLRDYSLPLMRRRVAAWQEHEGADGIEALTERIRTDPSALGTILIATRDGVRVPLLQLAEIRVVNGASIIARRDNKRQISVRTNIRGRDQGGSIGVAQLQGVGEQSNRRQSRRSVPATYPLPPSSTSTR